MDETVTIQRDTAIEALRELELLIERTDDEDPDPLTGNIFSARADLKRGLESTDGGGGWDDEPCCTRPDETPKKVRGADSVDDALEMVTRCDSCGAMNVHTFTHSDTTYDIGQRPFDEEYR